MVVIAAAEQARLHHKIHVLFTRGDYDECLRLIEKAVKDQPHSGTLYFPMFTKAMVFRQQGLMQQSMQTLEDTVSLDPQNPLNLKQVGHSLSLLGKHTIALDLYEEASRLDAGDWEVYYDRGLCYLYLKQLPEAEAMFRKAIETEAHESSYQQLGKVQLMRDDTATALTTFQHALEHTPESADTLCNLGLLHLREGNNAAAKAVLEHTIAIHPQHPKAVLALGSVLQDGLDIDGALAQYRIAAHLHPDSPQVWNNVGLCFFGKQRYIAAIACLKRALYLGPFEWIVCYNLGLVHIHTEQYASAFNHFSAAINLKPSFAHTYMYLGITLARLGDFDNACHAYARAIEKNAQDAMFRLNYAITLYQGGDAEQARAQFKAFQELHAQLSPDDRDADAEMQEQATLLLSALG